MSWEEIKKMKLGLILDALVAEKVMGLKAHPHGPLDANGMCRLCYRPAGETDVLPEQCVPKPYSTDIAAAWAVVEKLAETHRVDISSGNSSWAVAIDQEVIWMDEGKDTAPHAICLAALRFLEKAEDDKKAEGN